MIGKDGHEAKQPSLHHTNGLIAGHARKRDQLHTTLHLMQNRRDQRRHPRRVVDRPARIVLAAGTEPCRIIDISKGGARLSTVSSSWLPRIFDLQDVFSGVRRAVARVWSKHHIIGVRFLNKRS